jgi:pimeloyl-ACP methyl ester carboxylesterase
MDLSVPVNDAAALHVRHWQGSADPPFLLLHGLGSNARMWDQVADRLAAAGHAAYAIDQRGHGESGPAGDDYDNATAAADTAAAAVALGVTGAVIAGHSWGALLALRLAAERPDLVAGIALIEGGWAHAGVVLDSWDQFTRLLTKPESALKGATLESVRDYHRAVYPDWPEASIEAALRSLRVNEDGSLAPCLPSEQREAIMRSIWNDPPAQWFSAVKVPALLMPAIPKPERRWEMLFTRMSAYVEPAASALSGATVREYVDGDHDLHAQYPDRVAADLLGLVDEVRRRAAHRDRPRD